LPTRVMLPSLIFPSHDPATIVTYTLSLHDALPIYVNVAIGYGGREEIIDAAKSFLTDASDAGYTLHQAIQILNVDAISDRLYTRSEEHTSELQSRFDLVCRLLLEKKNKIYYVTYLL